MMLDRSLRGLCLACACLGAAPAWAQTQPTSAPAAAASAAGAGPWVAAAQRSARPELAPRLTAFEAAPELQRRRLSGVETPWPGNLPAIARQGAWYSPLFRPGMTGPYDLRAWHPPSP